PESAYYLWCGFCTAAFLSNVVAQFCNSSNMNNTNIFFIQFSFLAELSGFIYTNIKSLLWFRLPNPLGPKPVPHRLRKKLEYSNF
ncbi:hypothetical protein, partial [Leptospira santarosai]|uniref:hypothetical protein n=1 Tax=Leptospira santarosai TaxID=28183 RepID=UPI001E64920D